MEDREIFINKTKEILLPGSDYKRISEYDFRCIETKEKQKCILIFGMNPAGDETDVNRQIGSTYLYYIPEIEDIKNRTYKKYHKPILDVLSEATNNDVKWSWCNYSRDEIKKIIDLDTKLAPYKETILDYYDSCQRKQYSIYLCEFFYFHMTKQNDFFKLLDKSKLNGYFIEMLNKHIEEIIANGHSVESIYINNATASNYLCKDFGIKGKYSSSIDYNNKGQNIKILLGSMLSGQRAMDNYSKARLISDIKNNLSNQ